MFAEIFVRLFPPFIVTDIALRFDALAKLPHAQATAPAAAVQHGQRVLHDRNILYGGHNLSVKVLFTDGSKSSGKVHSFGKRDHAIKRNPNVPVVVRGWLYKQDSSGMRLWKRKWFVLSDYCLFYYKDSREEAILGSIPLPSYVIAPVEPEDHINRKFAFKACHTGMRSYIYNRNSVIGSQAEHGGMRTYYFSADTQEDMNGWIRAMNQAALMQTHSLRREADKVERLAAPQTSHINSQQKSPTQTKGSHWAKQGDGEPVGFEKTAEVHEDPGDRARYDPIKRPPESRGQARSQSRGGDVDTAFPDSAPPAQKNGLSSEQNGDGLYKRGLLQQTDAGIQVQRKTNLVQVENWVKVQKGDAKSLPAPERVLSRRTPPLHPKAGSTDTYQLLPKSSRRSPGGTPPSAPRDLPSDYKYAADRVSHLRMSADERVATKEGTVWQLYEWQQRQQFRHGSPTAPLYTDGGTFRVTLEVPRSVSVPPSPCDIPPPGPPSRGLSPRRPHTPAERVTVRPPDERPAVDVAPPSSPRVARAQLSKTSQIERRSMPPMGYITHTVSAPSLHGKTPEELTLLLIQLRRHQAKMASVRNDTLAQLQRLGAVSGPGFQADDTYMQLKKDLEYLDLKVTGREPLKDRTPRPVKIAESDVDVKLSRLCEQDKVLQHLESRIRTLKEDKDKLESVLDVSHQQMEKYCDQPAHAEKIAYQQRLLQEDVVHIRAEISQLSTVSLALFVVAQTKTTLWEGPSIVHVVSTLKEMENAWREYGHLETDLEQLREALQNQMSRSSLSQQEKTQMRKELWRIEDVMAGLSSSKANYQVTIDSVQNPERKLVPSVSPSLVPSLPTGTSAADVRSPQHSLAPEGRSSRQPLQQPGWAPQAHSLQKFVPKWAEEDAPPRPPLPQLYSPEDQPPAVPPLPKETSVIRHTSVRGLKRQSDERKRDREIGHYVNGDYKVEIRSYLSEPELLGVGSLDLANGGMLGSNGGGYQTLPSKGRARDAGGALLQQSTHNFTFGRLAGSTSRLNQSTNISSYVTLRRGATASGLKERPKSALERLYSEPQRGGRMSADEQLERMKRHQKALVRERKRTLSQGDRQGASSRASSSCSRPLSADLGSWRREQEFDLRLLERAVQGEERPAEHREQPRSQSDEWLTALAKPERELDLEPLDYDLDLSRELSKPQKVCIPERYVDMEPEEPLSQQEMEARYRKVERIKSILAKSSVQSVQPSAGLASPDFADLDHALQEKERIITMSYALASEASQKSKQVAGTTQLNLSRHRSVLSYKTALWLR
ncbi:pleckstrin-like domain-containing family A member 7-like [Scleropages formosus]|uniref:Pleckstrin-like domain-containing family A member 7-like n=1 Tax=Scleropages formosus TaxID=113540 RepID=A0A0P7VN52_SCLFO|nr:pleckstrin-like domain-containing family A member 7-like [Scleropages formosus]